MAIKSKDFNAYCECTDLERRNIDLLRLGNGLLLVLSKVDGCPNMPDWNDMHTFTVMSRHGVLVIVQGKRK